MSIRVDWYDKQQKTILHVFQGRWTWHMLAGAHLRALALFDSVSHPVDNIIDLRKSRALPGSYLQHIHELRQFPALAHRNARYLVLLDPQDKAVKPPVRATLRTLFPEMSARTFYAETLAEAEAVLASAATGSFVPHTRRAPVPSP